MSGIVNVCVRRPSVYPAPSSWPASANVYISSREQVQQKGTLLDDFVGAQ